MKQHKDDVRFNKSVDAFFNYFKTAAAVKDGLFFDLKFRGTADQNDVKKNKADTAEKKVRKSTK